MATNEPALLYNPDALAHNARAVQYVRSICASVCGASAGILGLTNWSGFAYYLVTSLAVGGIIAVQKTGRKPDEYFQSGTWELLTSGLLNMENATGYILFWTLLYGLVHVYE